MARYLLIGDMHVTPESIPECQSLIKWVGNLSHDYLATPVLMGDQFDTHGNVRVEVLEFWHSAFEILGKHTIALVGNHDMNLACTHSSLKPYEGAVRVVPAGPECIFTDNGGTSLWVTGFVKDSNNFVSMMSGLPITAKYVLCHQEFNGAKYESGFYAPHGVQPEDLPQHLKFISGHIHLKQKLGDRILYVGTPRQVTRSDDDDDKSIWLFESDTGALTPIRVPDDVCPRFKRIELTEGMDVPDITTTNKTFVDVKGSAAFIKKMIKSLPEGCKVRTFPDKEIKSTGTINESDGIGKAFVKYVDLYCTANTLDAAMSAKVLDKLKSVCPEVLS